MSTPIGDQAAQHLIRHGVLSVDAIERVWHELTHHNTRAPYDHHDAAQQRITAQPEGITVSLLDDITSELTALGNDTASAYQHGKTVLEQHLPGIVNVVAQAEQDAARLARFESEPVIGDIMGILEAGIPGAREVITPVVAMLKGLGSAAAPAAPVEAAPAEPAPAA